MGNTLINVEKVVLLWNERCLYTPQQTVGNSNPSGRVEGQVDNILQNPINGMGLIQANKRNMLPAISSSCGNTIKRLQSKSKRTSFNTIRGNQTRAYTQILLAITASINQFSPKKSRYSEWYANSWSMGRLTWVPIWLKFYLKVTHSTRGRHEPRTNSSAPAQMTMVRSCAIKAVTVWEMINTPWWLCDRTSTSDNKVRRPWKVLRMVLVGYTPKFLSLSGIICFTCNTFRGIDTL